MTVSFDKKVTRGAPLEDRQAAPEFSTDPQRRMSDRPVVRPPEKRIWHLDSDTENCPKRRKHRAVLGLKRRVDDDDLR